MKAVTIGMESDMLDRCRQLGRERGCTYAAIVREATALYLAGLDASPRDPRQTEMLAQRVIPLFIPPAIGGGR